MLVNLVSRGCGVFEVKTWRKKTVMTEFLRVDKGWVYLESSENSARDTLARCSL